MIRLPGHPGFAGENWHYTDPIGNTAEITVQPNALVSISTDGQDSGSVVAHFTPGALRWLANLGQRVSEEAGRG
ncbi:hypothetical protein [Micromonospora sp. NPDC050695]|uniref:hypothetical protein n=1 Tax=Micromonospora sp. NPDC050695 TaxID=3154938 RepID=UPI0033F6D806